MAWSGLIARSESPTLESIDFWINQNGRLTAKISRGGAEHACCVSNEIGIYAANITGMVFHQLAEKTQHDFQFLRVSAPPREISARREEPTLWQLLFLG